MLSENARKIADEAKAKGLWLYCPEYKHWYTPEEFKYTFTYANAEDEFLKRLQIRNPIEGVKAGFKRLTEIQNRLDLFSEKVVTYYKK